MDFFCGAQTRPAGHRLAQLDLGPSDGPTKKKRKKELMSIKIFFLGIQAI